MSEPVDDDLVTHRTLLIKDAFQQCLHEIYRIERGLCERLGSTVPTIVLRYLILLAHQRVWEEKIKPVLEPDALAHVEETCRDLIEQNMRVTQHTAAKDGGS